MPRGNAGEALARIGAEIEKEKAEALGRAGERLEVALRTLRILRDEAEALETGRATPVDWLDPRQTAARRRAEYDGMRRAAQQHRHYLVVQREAMGFRKHSDVDRLYPIPGPLRARNGFDKGGAMKITLRLFASVREIVGAGELSLDAPDGCTVGQVLQRMGETYPRLKALGPTLMLAVNREYRTPDTPLADGDEVGLIPPVSGGDGDGGTGPAGERDLYRMSDRPLSLDALAHYVGARSSGAVAGFLGIVRETSRGRQVTHLEYEAYPEMAETKMRQIGAEIRAKWPVDAVAIAHRTGRLGIGEASVAIAVASPHRHEALDACAFAIERLKQIVPIWKKEVWADGSEWIGSTVDEYQERNAEAGRA